MDFLVKLICPYSSDESLDRRDSNSGRISLPLIPPQPSSRTAAVDFLAMPIHSYSSEESSIVAIATLDADLMVA